MAEHARPLQPIRLYSCDARKVRNKVLYEPVSLATHSSNMLNSSTSVWLGITFVLVGAINVWLILQASARVRDAKASTRLIAAHRIGGYLFVALFCVMGYFMVARLGDVGGASPGIMIHLTLAM